MYDLDRRQVVKIFRGYKQQLFMLKCEFGGVNDSFVTCGSDDGQVYIWSKETEELIQRLGNTDINTPSHHYGD